MSTATRSRWLLVESLRTGTYASLAMIPFGVLFRALDLRIGHYGKKVVEAAFGELSPPLFRALVLVEHFIIGWISALPLLWLLMHKSEQRMAPTWIYGAAYGTAYYVLLNSLFLPWFFDDPLPWTLGFTTVYPSLIVHIVFGLTVVWTSKRFVGGLPARPA